MPLLEETVTDSATRRIVNANLGDYLVLVRDHRKAHLRARMKAGPAWQDTGLVFCQNDGRPGCHSPLVTVKPQLKLCGAGGARTHDRRIMSPLL